MQSCAYLSYFQIVVYYLSLVIFTSLHRFTVHGMDTYIFPLHRSDIFSISLRFKLSTLTYHQTVQKLSYTSPLSAFLVLIFRPSFDSFHILSPFGSMMYIRQMLIFMQECICTWLIVFTKK